MKSHQRGASLILVLVSLTVLLLASAALLRSSDTAMAISANIASKQGATQAADIAFADAGVRIANLADRDVNASGWYYATTQDVDEHGLPRASWATVPEIAAGNYRVQYIVDRLCRVAPVTDAAQQCATAAPTGDTSSKRVGAAVYIPLTAVYYRVTARVVGPKQSESFVQALFTK